jgi:arsenate reductase
MLTIYHNTRCKISRKVLNEIKEKVDEKDIEIREYLKEPPSIEELRDLLVRLNLEPMDIIRKQEKIFKENFKGKSFSDEEWLRILNENPKLIERPIVVRGNKAVLCRPPERVEEILQ